MKKLFVLFLLVALVPFSIGCSLFGDDDDDAVAYTTVTKVVTMPASVISGGESLRAAVSFKKFAMYLNAYKLTATKAEINANGTHYDVTFSTSLPSVTVSSELVGKSVAAKITTDVTGSEVTFVTFTYTPPSSSTSDIITITVDSGTLKPTGVTVANGSSSVTTSDFAAGATLDLTKYTFTVSSALYDVTPLAKTQAGAITVTTTTPEFVLTFSENPTNLTAATWEIVVSSVDANGAVLQSYTLNTTNDAAIFSITEGDAANKAKVKVLGDSTKKLENGKTYQVQVSANNLKAGTDPVKYLDTPTAYFFKVVLP